MKTSRVTTMLTTPHPARTGACVRLAVLLLAAAALRRGAADTVLTRDRQVFDGYPLDATNEVMRLRTVYGEIAVPRDAVKEHQPAQYEIKRRRGAVLRGQILADTDTVLTVRRRGNETLAIPRNEVLSVRELNPRKDRPVMDLRQRQAEHAKAIGHFSKKEYKQALAIYDRLLASFPNDSLALYNSACALALTGREDRAVLLLERSVEQGFVNFDHIEKDPDLDTLRRHPAYKALLERRRELSRKTVDASMSQLTDYLSDRNIDIDAYQRVYDPESNLAFLHAYKTNGFAAVRARLEAYAEAQWEHLFAHRPGNPIYVILLTPADSPRVFTDNVGGRYVPSANALLCGDMPAYKLTRANVVRHEFTHALHWGDALVRRQQHPLWLVEGLASLFETSELTGDGRVVPRHNTRLGYLQDALRKNLAFSWSSFLADSETAFTKATLIAYAQARYMLYYFHELGLLRTFYDTYTDPDNYGRDRKGPLAVAITLGKPLASAEHEWRRWVLALDPPPITYLGITTGIDDGKILVRGVSRKSPAEKAGIRKNDLLLTVDGRGLSSASDLSEFVGNREPGDEVDIGLGRGGDVLTVTVKLAGRPARGLHAYGQPPYLGVGVREDGNGIVIHQVTTNSPACRAGLQPGARILKLGGTPTPSLQTYLKALQRQRAGRTIDIDVLTDASITNQVSVKLGSAAR